MRRPEVCKKDGHSCADARPLATRERRSESGSGEADQGFGERERSAETAAGRVRIRQSDSEGGGFGKLLSPVKLRQTVEQGRDALGRERVSDRRLYKVLRNLRSTQHRWRRVPSK